MTAKLRAAYGFERRSRLKSKWHASFFQDCETGVSRADQDFRRRSYNVLFTNDFFYFQRVINPTTIKVVDTSSNDFTYEPDVQSYRMPR